MKKQQIVVDFDKAPRGKFIVIGHRELNRTMLHSGANNFSFAKWYADKISRGEIAFNSLLVEIFGEFSGIEVIDDKGRLRHVLGSPFGNFLIGGA